MVLQGSFAEPTPAVTLQDRKLVECVGQVSEIRFRPVPNLLPFAYHFWQNTIIYKQYPFHIPSLELCSPFNCSKCAVFKIWIITKTEHGQNVFSTFVTEHDNM